MPWSPAPPFIPPPPVCADAMVSPVTRAAAAVVTRNDFLRVFLIGKVSLLILPLLISDNAPARSKVLVRTRRIRRDSCRFQRKAAQNLNPSEQHRIDQDQSQNTARAIAPSRRCAARYPQPPIPSRGLPSRAAFSAYLARGHF